jgi:hypothetical protein
MALIDDLKEACDRLAPLGWRDLLMKVTENALDIQQPTTSALRAALLAPLASIDRTLSGFTDFAGTGKQAITPFAPVRRPLGSGTMKHENGSPRAPPPLTPRGRRAILPPAGTEVVMLLVS